MYNKIFFNLGNPSFADGLGAMIEKVNQEKIPVFLAATDTMGGLHDLQTYGQKYGVANVGNYRLTGYAKRLSNGLVVRVDPGTPGAVHLEVPNYHAQPDEAASQLWALQKPLLPPELDKDVVWISPVNEVVGYKGWGEQGSDPSDWPAPIPGFEGWCDWQAAWGIEMARLMWADGYKCCLFNWASGNPEIAGWESPHMLDLLRLMAKNKHRLAMGLHEYCFNQVDIWQNGLVGRFQELHRVCDKRGIGRPTIHITEWGWEQHQAPAPAVAMGHIDAAAAMYAQHSNIAGAAMWTLLMGNWQSVNKQVQALIKPVGDLTISKSYPSIDPPDPPVPDGTPRVQYTRRYMVINHDPTISQFEALLREIYTHRMTLGFSFDDAGIMDLDRRVVLVRGTKINPIILRQWYEIHYPGCELEFYTFGGSRLTLDPFRFDVWPVDGSREINQVFGNNPAYYAQFDLPGHEGIDFAVKHGAPIRAVAPGVVVDVHPDPGGHNYGIFVRVQHDHGYQTTYAHLSGITVSLGQRVEAGEQIGKAGTTGNSTGTHLHLTLKHDDAGKGESKYIGYPANIIDPTPYTQALMLAPSQNADKPRGYPRVQYKRVYHCLPQGALLDRYVTVGRAIFEKRGTLGFSYDDAGGGALLDRQAILYDLTPDRHNEFLAWYGQHYPGTTVDFVGNSDPVEPPPATSDPGFGLHAPADPGDFWGGGVVHNEFRILADHFGRRSMVKVLNAHSAEAIRRVAIDSPKAKFVVRAFLSMHGRNVSPLQFFNDTLPDTRRALDQLTGRDVVIELHNEPNLSAEGLTHNGAGTWATPADFNDWYLEVLGLYRQALPGKRFIFPGLSPGAAYADAQVKKWDSLEFLRACALAIGRSDGVALHAYWSSVWPMQKTLDQLDQHIALAQSKKIWVTEASINDRPAVYKPREYADHYHAFWQALRQRPGIEGVTFFVASASDPTFEPESWVYQNGQSKGIAQALTSLPV